MSLPRFSKRGIAMPLLALFFALDMHGTAAVTWTGDTGNWSNTALWNPKTAPVNSSSSTQTITFGGEGGTAYTATQNIATPLYLGVLVLESSASVTETIAGNSLQIQGGGVASILQNGSGDFLIRNNIVMGNSVNFSGTGSGTVTLAGVISGAAVPKLNLSNTGDAALILTGANTYSAGTNVSAGTLLVNNTSGSGTGSAAVAVAASGAKNAFLGGTGTLAGAVTVGGGAGAGTSIVDAGANGIGTLSLGTGLAFSTKSTLSFQLDSASGTIDLLHITGALTLGNGIAGLMGSDLNIGSAALSMGQTFVLASADSISGTFADYADGSLLSIGDVTYRLNYGTLNGYANKLTMNVVTVPEPRTFALVLGVGCALLLQARRRRIRVI